LILKNSRIEKSLIELEATFVVLFPKRHVLAIIKDIAVGKEILLLLNLTWFLADQIVLVRFIIAAVIVSLY
jgi:hypothetical protein